MNKMAIFAEGRTEVEFNKRLILELAAPRAVTIETKKILGGSTIKKYSQRIAVKQSCEGEQSTHYFLIYNCANDAAVKNRMIEEYPYLSRAGYSKIICHRDAAPTATYADLEKFERQLSYGVRTRPIEVTFVLSVMEVESWFLAEHLHFPLIDPALTIDVIKNAMGFDPSLDDMQKRPAPAIDLATCYAIAGKKYDKQTSQTTIDALDCANIVLALVEKFPHLAKLCAEINKFLDN
jgi:hypothetical protein